MTGDIDLSLVTEQGTYDLTAKGGTANIGGMYVGLCSIAFASYKFYTGHVIEIYDSALL